LTNQDDRRHSSPILGGRRGHHRDEQFGATSITQSEFLWKIRARRAAERIRLLRKDHSRSFLRNLAWEINEQSARQCREWADRVGTKRRQRFVRERLGRDRVAFEFPDADDAGFRVVTFDQSKRLC